MKKEATTPWSHASFCPNLGRVRWWFGDRSLLEESAFSYVTGSRDSRGLSVDKPFTPRGAECTLFRSRSEHSAMSASAVWPPTSPAPDSRGPLMPVPPTLVRAHGLCSHRWGRHRRRASFRMPSDETLRVLWSARYPCSIFHHLWSRLSMSICHSSAMTPPR